MVEDESKLGKFKRNNYFTGKLMAVSDFTNEQDYFNDKLSLIKKAVLGSGCVYGLKINYIERSGTNWEAYLTPGVAFAPNGKEIIVDADKITVDTDKLISFQNDPIKFLNDESQKDKFLALFLEPIDQLDPQMVPRLSTASTCKENCESPYTIENFKAYFDTVEISEGLPLSEIDYSASNINKFASDFYDNNLKETCFGCTEEAKVLVAALKEENANKLVVDEDRTKERRKVVYNNSLIYRLFAEHLLDTNDVGRVDSVNGLRGTIKLDSTTLDFKTKQDDENIPSNVLMIEPKLSALQILTGTVKLIYNKTPPDQYFGPVPFNMGNLTMPPAVILANTNETFDIANYSQQYLDASSAINFAPINVHPDHFDIRLWIKTPPSTDANPLFIRYYLLAPTGQIDKLDIPKIEGARIATIPSKLLIFNDVNGVRVEIRDPKQPDSTTVVAFDVSSTYLPSKVTTKAARVNDIFKRTVIASSTNYDDVDTKKPSTINTKPGDELSITYKSQNILAEQKIKVMPAIKIKNKLLRDHVESLTGTVVDISEKNTTTKLMAFVDVGGMKKLISLNSDVPRSENFAFSIPIEFLKLADLYADPKFNGKATIRILYEYLAHGTAASVSNSIESTIPGFTINGRLPDIKLSFQKLSEKLNIFIVDSELPPGKQVKLNVKAAYGNEQELTDEISIGTPDKYNRVKTQIAIENIIKKIASPTIFKKLVKINISYPYKVGDVNREIPFTLIFKA